MTDYSEVIEICKIAQHLEGPQNLSAVGIGTYLRKCSPELVLKLIAENERLKAYALDLGVFWSAEIGRVQADNERLRESHEQICTNYNRVSFASEERGKQIDQLKAENEALRRNAERYEWLRSQSPYPEGYDQQVDIGMRREVGNG